MELFHITFGFDLSSGRCHTNVAMNAFLQQPLPHSHAPNPNRLHVIWVQNGIKERSASSEEITSVIVHNALRAVPLNIAAELSSMDALAQCVRRQRPALNLDVNSQLPEILKQTDRGENFVLHEDDSMIIFTTKSNLNVLKQCQHWFCDGTFSVSMAVFYGDAYSFWFRCVRTSSSSYLQFMAYTRVRSCHWCMPYLSVNEQRIMITSLRNCCRSMSLIRIQF